MTSALIVSAVSPVPVDNGKRAVLSGLLAYLIDRLGAHQVHYALVAAPDDELPALRCHVHRLNKPTAAEKLLSAARATLTGSGTLQEAMLHGASLRREIAGLVQRLGADVEVYDTVRLGQHAPAHSLAGLRVLYMDDLFSRRYERMLQVGAEGGADMDPLGEFANNVPRPLRRVVRRPTVYRPLLRFEGARIRRRESEVPRGFDATLLVNGEEATSLQERSGAGQVRTLTPLLPDLDPDPRMPATPAEFVFLGRLNIPHNDDAICTFLRTAWPEVARRSPGAVVRVVGKGATPELRQLAEEHRDSVRLEGFVADLDEVFARATAVLAPLRFGSGVKIKVLEALARGVPVVGTSTAAEGIPVGTTDSRGCLVEDDLQAWAPLMESLVDPGVNRAASQAARTLFTSTYTRDVVYAQYDEVFRLGGPVAAGAVRRPAGDAPAPLPGSG